ncbi:MAG: hypothetical protein FWF33_02305, partial [Clostridiales bacterium]|nr:hypothetical protein [Clostridiales bacterium]
MTLGDCAEALWRIPNNEEEQIRRDDLAAEMSELIDTSMGFIEGDQSAATKFLYHYCAIGWMCGPKPDEPDAGNALAAYKALDTLVRFAYYLYVAENLPKSNAGMRRANAESAAALRQGWGVQTNFEWALMLRTILEFYRFGLSEFWTSVKDMFDKKESRIPFDPIGILQNMERFRVPPDEAEYTGMFHEIAGRSDNTEFYMIWREYLRCRVAEQIRKTQLDILSYIRGVCEQNGLPCFLAYETLYDALYPGKLDRVPVQATMMAPVSTIDALERLLSADKTCRFELLSRRFDDHCWFTGLRVISKNVKADMKADRPYYSRNHGVYAEIIPYVPVPPRKEFKTTIRYRTAQLTEWEIRQRIAGRRYLTKLPERLFSASCRPRSLHELVRKMDALRTIPVQNATQTRIMGYRFKQDHREVIPGSWLEKVDSIEYFGNHYSVPGSSAELLARLYPSADAGFEISGEPGNRFADNGPDSLLVIPKETRLIEGSLPKRGPRIKKVMRSGLSLLKEVSRPARRTAADMAT